MSALVLENVSRSFGGVRAVSDVCLSVPEGRITGLIGPNGAGKTTVINLISGLLKVTQGRILLGDRDITHLQPSSLARLGLSRTFQNIRLIGKDTVLENVVAGFHCRERSSVAANLVGWPSAIKERREFEERAQSLLQRFGLRAFAGRPAGELSYGHQRRIEIMRALAMEPSVLLLDEPVAGMNDAEAFELTDVIRSVAEQGVSVLLIDHNMRFVMSLCESLYVLAAGKVIAQGTPLEIGQNNAVIEAYLGERAC